MYILNIVEKEIVTIMTKRANAEKTPTGGSDLLKKITAIGSIAAVAFGLGGCSSTEASPAPAPASSHALENTEPTESFKNTPELSGVENIESRGFTNVMELDLPDAIPGIDDYMGWEPGTSCLHFFQIVTAPQGVEDTQGNVIEQGTVYLILRSPEDASTIGAIKNPEAGTLAEAIKRAYPNSGVSGWHAECSGS